MTCFSFFSIRARRLSVIARFWKKMIEVRFGSEEGLMRNETPLPVNQ